MCRSQVRWMVVATPLCPAGHLPHKGEDWLGAPTDRNVSRRNTTERPRGGKGMPLVISPLVGEMAGRPEGGELAPAVHFSSQEARHVPRSRN